MAATEASTPRASTETEPVSSMRHTPAMPAAAPSRGSGPGRSATSAQAISIMATGEAAMIVEAVLVGSSCAAT